MPLNDLDSDQRTAATASGSQVAISAGAGSGKTRVLVGHYLYLLKQQSIPVSTIAAITFTEKAAAQMKVSISQRARKLADDYRNERKLWMDVASEIYTAPISTIHAFCNSILRSYPLETGIDPLFTILDDITLSNLTHETLDNFIQSRMEDAPENMDTLVGAFGMTGLKDMFKMLLSQRTRLTTYLDICDFERPEDIESRYIKNLKMRFENMLTMLREFHALGPGDDILPLVLDKLAGGILRLIRMFETGDMNIELVENLIKVITDNIRKGSSKKWNKSGVQLGIVKEDLKKCRDLLNIIVMYYRHERGVTARIAMLILYEYGLYEQYFLAVKKSRSCLDHDDTLIETWRLLRNNINVCQQLSRSYKHILVDEFQDTDGLQMDILGMIAGNSATTLFTVGDPKQSIYRFRGADVTIFNDFIAHPHVDFKTLKKNYRSAPSIIAFLNHAFGHILGRDDPEYAFEARYIDMKPHRKNHGDMTPVKVVVIEDENGGHNSIEADFIACHVLELKNNYNYHFSDMALILRKKTIVHHYEEAFLAHKIPFVNITGGNPAQNPETFDISNLLGWLCEPNDPVLFTGLLMSPFFQVDPGVLHAIRRITGQVENMPRAFLYDTEILKHQWLKDTDLPRIRKILLHLLSLRDRVSIRDVLEHAFEETGYTVSMLADPIRGDLSLSVIDLIMEFADTFELNGGGIREFARILAQRDFLTDKTPRVETKEDAVNIITIHKAKGLEYKIVFLADITCKIRKDTKPLVIDKELGIGFSMRAHTGETLKTFVSCIADVEKWEEKMEKAESKRLFYVGCTRAEDHLIISGEPPQKKPDDTFDGSNWMGWLHAALDITPEGEFLENSPRNLFEYSRIGQEALSVRISPVDYWKKTLNKSLTAEPEKHPGIDSLIKQHSDIPSLGKPEHLSPTEIMDYIACPSLYLFKHIYNLQGDYPAGERSGFGESYGTFAHKTLERWNFTNHDKNESLEKDFGKEYLTPELIKRLNHDLKRFSECELYHRISEADKILCEEPFAFMHDGVLIRGNIDVVYKTGDSINIVDYKTENISPEEVEQTAERFRIQLGLYGAAVYMADYRRPDELILHFLTPGISHRIKCSSEFLDETFSVLSGVIESLSTGDYSPEKSGRCDFCPYSQVCLL